MARKPGELPGLASFALAMLLVVAAASLACAAADANGGSKIYRQYCTQCHGENGDGRGPRARNEALRPPPRDHSNGFYMNMQTDVHLFRVIKLGGEANNLSHIMPQWRHILDDEKIFDLVAFIRTMAKDPSYRKPEMKNWGKNPFTPDELEPLEPARTGSQ